MEAKNTTAAKSNRNARDNNGRLIRFNAPTPTVANRNARNNNGRLVRFN